jgi:thiamine-monophosphate kinase
MISSIVENQLIQRLTASYRRSPLQLNQLHEADAEIIRIPTESDAALTITTDSIVEEITSGLYRDPYLIGWMIVMVNMSDLAATGARPLGMLISEALPPDTSDSMLEGLHRGIQDACTSCGTYILGGDTNFNDHLILTGCAVGTVHPTKSLRRIGCRPDDLLYSTGRLGLGNAFAISRLYKDVPITIAYQPVARLKEAQSLAGIANACMDTSDGVIATLDQLMRLNNVGFELADAWPSSLHPMARRASQRAGLPEWLLLAGQHGEFELLFTVASEKQQALNEATSVAGWAPIHLGRVIGEQVLRLSIHGDRVDLDSARIRNLAYQINGDVESYIAELLRMDRDIQKGVCNHERE